MEQKSSFDNFDQEVVYTLESQMLPVWERYGAARLAVGTDSLEEFRQQSLPEHLRVWERPRKGKMTLKRREVHRGARILKSWPEDDQESLRFPVLVYVRTGQTDFRLGNYVVQCPAGHFLLLPPGVSQPAGATPHFEKPFAGKQCELWRFISTGNYDHVALSVCYSAAEKHLNSGHFYIVNDPHVTQLFHIFTQEAVRRPDGYQLVGEAVFQAFLRLFLREIKQGRFYNRGEGNLPKSASSSYSPIEAACQYIDKNLNHPLTIDIVAQSVFMGRTSFTRQFQRETGKTFREYLIERRLEEAKHWLLQETCSIDIVCKFVGLKNSRFHQLFSERFGMTPIEFRRKYKNT